MKKVNLILLNIAIISLLVYAAGKILDIFNPYMDLESALVWSLPLAIVIVLFMLFVKLSGHKV